MFRRAAANAFADRAGCPVNILSCHRVFTQYAEYSGLVCTTGLNLLPATAPAVRPEVDRCDCPAVPMNAYAYIVQARFLVVYDSKVKPSFFNVSSASA